MIEIVSGGNKLEPAKLKALNLMLRNGGGEWQGQPQFRLSWAADDNLGLAKQHTCGKTDPFDWECSCLPKALSIPVCFNKQQMCYHLLSFHPVADQNIESSYDCVIHFSDPWGVPVDPTSTIIERVLPVLQHAAQSMWAARFGVDAALQRERKRKKEAEQERYKERERKWQGLAHTLIEETVPVSAAHTGYGPKTRQFADLSRSDAASELKKFVGDGSKGLEEEFKKVVLTDL